MTGDQHHVGVRFGHTCRNSPDSDCADQLHVYPRTIVCASEVVDQLGEILDRIDVVVRGRRNEPDPRRRVPGFRDPRVHLGPRKLPSFTGLGTLGHLDLNVGGIDQVIAGHPEAPTRDLLDCASTLVVTQPLRRLSALTGVGTPAESIHRNRHRLVRLRREGTVAHRTGVESSENHLDGFDLIERNRRTNLTPKSKQSPRCSALRAQSIDFIAVAAKHLTSPGPGRMLKEEHGFGCEHMQFTIAAIPVLSAVGQLTIVELTMLHCGRRERSRVTHQNFSRDFGDTDPADPAPCVAEVFVDQLSTQAHGLEYLCARVGVNRSDSHLRHHFEHAEICCSQVVVRRSLRIYPGKFVLLAEGLDRFESKIRVDSRRTVADQQRDVMNFARVTRVDDKGNLGPQAMTNQIVVHG